MANEYVGDLAVRIVPDGSGLPAAIADLLKQVSDKQKLKPGVDIDTSNASKSIAALGNQINNEIGGGFARAGIEAAAFTAAVYGAKSMVDGLVNKFAGLYDPLVKATAGFKAILGADKGSVLLGQIQQFAKESPFVTGELVSYSQQLLGVGMAADQIVPLLNNVGDLVASLGGDQQSISRVLFTLTQIKSIGRLAGQDAMQLQSAQIPITKLLADYLHKTNAEIMQLKEGGKISADQVFGALMMAGGKVKGSMDAVSNSISGAKAILGDTITLSLQKQAGLKAIYDDIVKAIKLIATTLDSPAFQEPFTKLMDNVHRSYEALKPLVMSMAEFVTKFSFSGLDVAATVIGGIATALNAIPKGVMQAFGMFLGALVAVKAPLMLGQYVMNLGKLASLFTNPAKIMGALGGTAAGIKKTGDEAETAARKISLYDKAISGAASTTKRIKAAAPYAAAAGLTMGGMMLGNTGWGKNTAEGAGTSGALTMAGVGASIGMAIGPEGAVVGAIGGALVGGISSYISKSRAIEKALKEKFMQIGKDSIKDFELINTGILKEGGELAYKTLDNRYKEAQTKLDTITNVHNQAIQQVAELDALRGVQQSGSYTGISNAATAAGAGLTDTGYLRTVDGINFELTKAGEDRVRILESVSDKIKAAAESDITSQQQIIQGQIDTAEADRDALIKPYQMAIDEIIKMNPETRKAFAELDKNYSQYSLGSSFQVNPDKLDEFKRNVLDPLGISFEELASKGPAVLAPIFAQFEQLPDPIKDATRAVTDFNNAITAAKTTDVIGPFKTQIATYKSMAEAAKSASDAISKVKSGESPGASSLEAINSRASAEYQLAYSNAMKGMSGKPMSEAEKGAAAQTAALKAQNIALAQSFLKLQDAMGTEKLDALLKATGAYELKQQTFASLSDMSEEAIRRQATAVDGLASSLGMAEMAVEHINLKMPGFTDAIGGIDLGLSKRSQFEAQGDLIKGITPKSDTKAIISTMQGISEEAKNVYSQVSAATQSLGAYESATQASVQSSQFLVDWFKNLQTALNYNDDQFRGLLESMGLYSSYSQAMAEATVVNQGTLSALAAKYNMTVDALAQVLNLQGQIDPSMNITITANADQAIQEMNYLAKAAQNAGLGVLFGNVATIAGQRAAPTITPPKFNSTPNGSGSSGGGGGGGGGGQSKADQAAQQLTESLKSAADAIKEAAKAWMTSIKESAKYDKAVSVATATKNATKQAADLTFVNTGIAQLKARGVSEEVLKSLGIDGPEDVKQIKKLMGASDAELAALNTAVSARDKAATDLAEARKKEETQKTITDAIIAAAKILGLKGVTPEEATAIAQNIDINIDAKDADMARLVKELVKALKAANVRR